MLDLEIEPSSERTVYVRTYGVEAPANTVPVSEAYTVSVQVEGCSLYLISLPAPWKPTSGGGSSLRAQIGK